MSTALLEGRFNVAFEDIRAVAAYNTSKRDADGKWPLAYMNSFGMTIAAGSNEIQRNILGERVLGMAKSK